MNRNFIRKELRKRRTHFESNPSFSSFIFNSSSSFMRFVTILRIFASYQLEFFFNFQSMISFSIFRNSPISRCIYEKINFFITLMFAPKMYFPLQLDRELIIAFRFFTIPSEGSACFGRIFLAL